MLVTNTHCRNSSASMASTAFREGVLVLLDIVPTRGNIYTVLWPAYNFKYCIIMSEHTQIMTSSLWLGHPHYRNVLNPPRGSAAIRNSRLSTRQKTRPTL